MNQLKINIGKEEIAEFCKKNHIKKLSFFGSVLRQDFGPKSDIDVLVEFEPGYVPGFSFFEMEEELSRIVGRRADLNTPQFISRYMRDNIMKELYTLYDAA